MTVRNSRGNTTIAAGAAGSRWTSNDVKLIRRRQCAQEVFQIRPWSLIVVGRLGHHVRHQERCLVDRDRSLLVAIRVRGHVTAIETTVGEVGCLHSIPIWRDSRIGSEGIDTR